MLDQGELPPPPPSLSSSPPGEELDSDAAGPSVDSRQVRQINAQVVEVVEIMKENLQKAIDRHVIIADLDSRMEDLNNFSEEFVVQASQAKQKEQPTPTGRSILQNMAVICCFLIVIILFFFAFFREF